MKHPLCKKTFEIKKDCIIKEYFIDSNDPQYYQTEYCAKNCEYGCMIGKQYKKMAE